MFLFLRGKSSLVALNQGFKGLCILQTVLTCAILRGNISSHESWLGGRSTAVDAKIHVSLGLLANSVPHSHCMSHLEGGSRLQVKFGDL